MKRLLITLGCSWTYGVGVGYTEGMSAEEYKSLAWNTDLCDQYSFRGLLCQKFGLENKNFSLGGSSNQAQFRRAKVFFSSEEFKKIKKEYDQILVLWGITSTARNELYNLQTNKLENFFYTTTDWPLGKAILKYTYNHDHEVDLLNTEINHWNMFFDSLGISNLWFDTFNHHDYRFPLIKIEGFRQQYESCRGPEWPTWEQFRSGNFEVRQDILEEINDVARWQFCNPPIKNLIFENKNPRDLLSLLCIKQGFDDVVDNKTHYSDWANDSNRIDFLLKCKILNPISKHPTKKGHQEIAELLSEPLQVIL